MKRESDKATAERAGLRRRDRRERGSALLIVFVFAAALAIMLYMELPVAAFEAQRNREQLVIDRGNEYAHAVKLFVRKFGMYPASIDQLENTNGMRFLRHRFKDPLTGKDDWRLLHAGPGGQLLDSKVNRIGSLLTGTQTNGTGGNSGSAPSANSSSSASGFNSTSSPAEVVVPTVPQRPPAIAANGSGQVTSTPEADQNPMTPLLATEPNAAQNGLPTPPGQQLGQANQNAGQPGAVPGAGSAGTAAANPNGMDTIRNLLTNPNPPAQTSGASMGNITSSGGIAGVASKAEGHSIKTVGDQSDYSLWEFYYDPTKDAMRGLANAARQGAAQSAAQINGQNPDVQSAVPAGAASSAGTPPQNPPNPPEQ